METITPTDLTVNFETVKRMKKAEILRLFEEKQNLWIKYLIQVGQKHKAELDAVGENLFSHPDYLALKERHDHLIIERDEAVRQRDRAKAKAESLKDQSGSWKKAGRKPLDPAVADRIVELRATGLSIRKIVDQLADEGMKASKGYVWNVLNDHKKNEQAEQVNEGIKVSEGSVLNTTRDQKKTKQIEVEIRGGNKKTEQAEVKIVNGNKDRKKAEKVEFEIKVR